MLKLLSIIILFSFPKTAYAQNIHIIDHTGIAKTKIAQIEKALLKEVNGPLRTHWHTPKIRFTDTGWPVSIIRDDEEPLYGYVSSDTNTWGFHGYIPPRTFAVIHPGKGYHTSLAIAHEIIEMLVNPKTNKFINKKPVEVCDPVVNVPVHINRILLSDFVFPGYFTNRPGFKDFAHFLP